MLTNNPYKSLGLDNFASVQEIKKAYRGLALTHHPDRGGDPKMMVELNRVYEHLIKNKEKIDRELKGIPTDIRGFTIVVNGWEFNGASAGTGAGRTNVYTVNF